MTLDPLAYIIGFISALPIAVALYLIGDNKPKREIKRGPTMKPRKPGAKKKPRMYTDQKAYNAEKDATPRV